MRIRFIRLVQHGAIATLALGVFLFLSAGGEKQPAHALPEYSDRSGEPCATCHVNPGGGGPRTLRGLLWAARGRPDQVPNLPGQLIAPGVSDGAELYDLACAGCHGTKGEGLFAMPITGTGISRPAIRTFVTDGIPSLGMPSFAGQFDEAQMEALLDYLAGLASGEISPPPDQYPLQRPEFRCDPLSPAAQPCGGN